MADSSHDPRSLNVDAWHEAIIAAIQGAFPQLRTVSAYPRESGKIMTPACFVSLVDCQPSRDPGTSQVEFVARWEALVVLGFKDEQAKRSVRALALDLGRYIYGQRWGVACGPARLEGVQPDAFSPELDQYETWRVDWTQDFMLGENQWKDTGTPPTEINIRMDQHPGYYGKP